MAKKVQDFIDQLDTQLNRREADLDAKERTISEREEVCNKQEMSFTDRQIEVERAERELEFKKAEVEISVSKVRSDSDLSDALRTQAEDMKLMVAIQKDVTEQKALTDIQLEEIMKREKALSVREETYKEEVENKIAKSFLNIR